MSSVVWKHFQKKQDNEKIVVCNICAAELKYNSSSTGGMLNHLKLKHSIKGTSPSTSTIDKYLKRPCSTIKTETIHKLIAEMLYGDLLPIKFVESPKLRNLISYLENGYTMPTRKTILSILTRKYDETKLELIQQLNESLSKVSVTTDCWMSINTESFITVTGHFIDKNWQYKSVVLATKYIEKQHTGKNIASLLDEIVTEFNLQEKCFVCVHDNAANMNLAMTESRCFNEENHFGCSVHTLQLSINGAFAKVNALQKAIAGVSRLVGHFKRSYKWTAELRKKQQQMNLPEHKLIQYCQTRWNSVLDMFQRIIEQRWPVSAVLSDRSITKLNDARTLDLREETWNLISDICNCLEALKIGTEMLSADKNVSVSLVLPVVYSLINKHLEISQDDSEKTKQFKNFASEDLKKRYRDIFCLEEDDGNDETVVPIIMIACFLDPRHKHMPFLSENLKEKVYANVRRKLGNMSTSSGDALQQPCTSKAARLFGENYSTFSINTIDDEMKLYISLHVTNMNSNPVLWWRDNRQHLQNLSILALDYLAIPASSVSSERMFSAAGRVLSKSRSSLSAKNVDMLLFLHKNADLF